MKTHYWDVLKDGESASMGHFTHRNSNPMDDINGLVYVRSEGYIYCLWVLVSLKWGKIMYNIFYCIKKLIGREVFEYKLFSYNKQGFWVSTGNVDKSGVFILAYQIRYSCESGFIEVGDDYESY